MRILYFTQFYHPEAMAASFRATDHSRMWAREGHDVTVFTCWPSYPFGKVFDGYEVSTVGEEMVEGVRVIRSKSSIRPMKGVKDRLICGGSMFVYGLRNALGKRSPLSGDYDVVLATSGIVFMALLGSVYAKRRHIPLVVEIRDITYRQMVATGSDERSLKVHLMRALELHICRSANALVVVTEGFKRTFVGEGIEFEDIFVVPNGADVVACNHEWANSLRLGYFGTMGISQDVIRTLEYARALYESGMLDSYLLIGEGAVRGTVEECVATGSYPFVSLCHGMPKEDLEKRYSEVDMTVVSLQKSESFAETIPSKIFQSFARGVPVLFVGPDGEAARIVRESGAGIVLCGTEEEDLDALGVFTSDDSLSDRLSTMSANAVSFMEQNYTRKRMAKRMLDIFERVAGKRQ